MLEVLEAAEDIGLRTRRPLEFVAWTNEEGGRFQPATMGSGVYVGAMDFESMLDVKDAEGLTIRTLLAETLAATPLAETRSFGEGMSAYIEAHIEQGPVLEREKKTIGVVTGIQGCRWFAVEIYGSEAHAGTTPFAARQDAFRAQTGGVCGLRPGARSSLRDSRALSPAEAPRDSQGAQAAEHRSPRLGEQLRLCRAAPSAQGPAAGEGGPGRPAPGKARVERE